MKKIKLNFIGIYILKVVIFKIMRKYIPILLKKQGPQWMNKPSIDQVKKLIIKYVENGKLF